MPHLILDHFQTKMYKSETKDSESLKINFEHPTSGIEGKIRLRGTSKSKQTDTHTHTHMDKLTYRKHQARGPML